MTGEQPSSPYGDVERLTLGGTWQDVGDAAAKVIDTLRKWDDILEGRRRLRVRVVDSGVTIEVEPI